MITIKISRVLCENGWRPYTVECDTHKIKRQYPYKFGKLSDLRDYYGIKKIIKTQERDFAIGNNGKRFEWSVQKAQIDDSFATV